MRPFKLITFDCYSALFDYKSTLVPALTHKLDITTAQADAVLRLWRTKQLEAAALTNALDKARVSFRECTRLALHYAAKQHRLPVSAEQSEALVAAWDALEPWPEATKVLEGIKERGYRVALLSNGDEAMLRALADNLDVAMDDIFSSETCGRYKPHPSVYRLPTAALGISAAQYLHVAGGAGDVVGAKAAGVACYWPNRSGDQVLLPAYAPDAQGDSLEGVLAVIR